MKEQFKLTISYDGTDFVGWQRHQNLATIEGVLLSSLEKIFNQPLRLEAASRTDAGVHAEAQIVCFSFKNKTISPNQLKLSLNQMLPKSIRILSVTSCSLNFHPSTHAIKKHYRYHVSTGTYQNPFDRFYSWHILTPLCKQSIDTAIPYFLGAHDFATFTNQSADPCTDNIRTLFELSFIQTEKDKYTFNITGDRFTYKMVRNIIGTLIHIGKGNINPTEIPILLSAKDRQQVGPTAPAQGLFLTKIHYSPTVLGDLPS